MVVRPAGFFKEDGKTKPRFPRRIKPPAKPRVTQVRRVLRKPRKVEGSRYFSQRSNACIICNKRIRFIGYKRFYRKDWKLKDIEHEEWSCPCGKTHVFTNGYRADHDHICNDVICACGEWMNPKKNGTFINLGPNFMHGDLEACKNNHKYMSHAVIYRKSQVDIVPFGPPGYNFKGVIGKPHSPVDNLLDEGIRR